MGAVGAAPTPGGKVMLNVFDGTRRPFYDPQSADLLITVVDGRKKVISKEFHKTPSTLFSGLPVSGNMADDYTFIAFANGYKQAGFFPVRIGARTLQIVDLMLIPGSNELNFSGASWAAMGAVRPALKKLLAAGVAADETAAQRYDDLKERQGGEILACLLNIAAAMGQVLLPQGTALDYLKMIRWELEGEHAMARDRFFAWADPKLIDQIEQAKVQHKFDDAPGTLHEGATRSYKQTEFGEANLQLTFHENDTMEVDGESCVLVEPDIDYFSDPAAHVLLEVLVNALGSLTDPRAVYVLRWIAGRRAGVPEFDPLYTIVRA